MVPAAFMAKLKTGLGSPAKGNERDSERLHFSAAHETNKKEEIRSSRDQLEVSVAGNRS